MKKYFFAFIFLFFSSFSFSQLEEGQRLSKRLSKLMKEADDALNDYKFDKAKKIYFKVLEEKPNLCAPKRALTAIYFYQNDYKNAAAVSEEVIERCPMFSRIMYYEQGQFYYRLGNYDKAIEYFERFKAMQKRPPNTFGYNGFAEDNKNRKYISIVEESIFQSVYARDSIPALDVSNISNVGHEINSNKNDYFPFMTNNESVLLYTRMITKNNEDFYVSYKKDGKWTKGKKIENNFNTSANEGMCTCTRDNIRMYFTACQRENIGGSCDIQQAILKVTDTVEVLEIEPLDGLLNSEHWESQASISCDGKMMFFSSSRLAGFGKTDIYVSYLQSDGSWSNAQNVGPNINSEDYEESPFITNDGKTLFFSSTGLLGMGEQDIYMSRLQSDGSWGKAVNLGSKVNTSARELGFFLTADGKTGYFASDRPGGQGQLDIYQFTLSQPIKSDPITFVEGFVKDAITKEPIQTILELPSDEKIATDKNGRFFRCLPPGNFPYQIIEKDYLPHVDIENIPEWDNRTFYPMEILLQKISFDSPKDEPIVKTEPIKKPSPTTIHNQPTTPIRYSLPPLQLSIYFDFDKSIIKNSELKNMEQFIRQLKNRNYSIIELKAYCDFKGTEEYNILLSNKRANSTYQFLIQAGVPPEKINYIGLGEINDNQPRWKNRRVDIFVR